MSTAGSPCRHHGCARDSYIRAAKKPLDVIYDLPGMADKMGGTDMTGYSFGPSPGNRDSYLKASRKCVDVVYDVPDMVEAMRRDPRGSYAFKNSGQGDRMTYITRHTKEVIRREPHNVPGMADALALSPKGTAAFRQSGARDSYTRAAKKPVDVVYDLPGVADKMGGTDMTGYSFGPSPGNRDSYLKASRKCVDVVYDVPDMVEAMRRDPRGSYAFKNSGQGDRMTYITRHTKEVIRREPHNIPGMADSLHQKKYGAFHACCPCCTPNRASSAPRRRATSAPAQREAVSARSSSVVSRPTLNSTRLTMVNASNVSVDAIMSSPSARNASTAAAGAKGSTTPMAVTAATARRLAPRKNDGAPSPMPLRAPSRGGASSLNASVLSAAAGTPTSYRRANTPAPLDTLSSTMNSAYGGGGGGADASPLRYVPSNDSFAMMQSVHNNSNAMAAAAGSPLLRFGGGGSSTGTAVMNSPMANSSNTPRMLAMSNNSFTAANMNSNPSLGGAWYGVSQPYSNNSIGYAASPLYGSVNSPNANTSAANCGGGSAPPMTAYKTIDPINMSVMSGGGLTEASFALN